MCCIYNLRKTVKGDNERECTLNRNGRNMEGTLNRNGRNMEGTWKGHGRDMEGTWKGHGRDMEGTWKGHGRDMTKIHIFGHLNVKMRSGVTNTHKVGYLVGLSTSKGQRMMIEPVAESLFLSYIVSIKQFDEPFGKYLWTNPMSFFTNYCRLGLKVCHTYLVG